MKLRKTLISLCMGGYLLNSVGCGVLLYPERQGQNGGRIDPVVALLDGIGLLLYVIPGLVAFAIDFHQGTIYLPSGLSYLPDGSPDAAEGNSGMRAVKIDGAMTEDNIEAALQRELGREVDISGANVQALRINRDQLGLIQSIARGDLNPVL